ncbi:single-stranded DNA-binding protein (plasmid) [Streptomyces globisporus]|uniref:single-stranded DNA-binding protein n=1 Tax=Streptomyces globisporus TaxID=1908 RepID=UPI002F90D0C1|nr:single-stranded DNA-binding protein [Streptomyces globisporus]
MRNDIPLTVIGNLVEDPELRFTPNGVPMARFTIASTPRTFDREADTWRDGEPTFLDCTTWRQPAENLAASAHKGARLVVAGRLRTERWESPEGEKRSKMVMDADEVAASMTFATVTITRTPPLPFWWSRNGAPGLRARHDFPPLLAMIRGVVSPGPEALTDR